MEEKENNNLENKDGSNESTVNIAAENEKSESDGVIPSGESEPATEENKEIEAVPVESAETVNTENISNTEQKKTTKLEDIYDWVEVFSVSIAIVLTVLMFVARIARVEGSSMNKTLYNNDILIITSLGDEPVQGDIVVVQQLGSYFKEPLVKRVIAKGGQTIVFDFESWIVTVDGVTLDEDYVNRIPLQDMKQYDLQNNVVYVPEGYVFVMGDNRNASSDSRSSLVGLVKENELIGKVILRLLPLTLFGKVR